ncbi:hypothetical protein BN946_scf184945.g51 [Trametes cinnabarina]|uniref:DUF6534 domain-containing protein n=1 Tax=Pycnoporus cinnabarinus TaxID=5643 RepID=A0A060SRY4_PYCCI|nr:hypothetical protein BN946_scf184945.g51 [Trametes cinnabarina]
MVNPAVFFDVTIGVTLVGLGGTAGLFGVSTAQALWYYKTYPRDRKSIKILVGTIWGFDAFHLVLYGVTMWTYLVEKQVQALGPTSLPWESSAQLLCNACAIVTIQLFYTYRIWTLSKSGLLAAMLAIVVLGDFGGSSDTHVYNGTKGTPSQLLLSRFSSRGEHRADPIIRFPEILTVHDSIMTDDVQDFIGLANFDIALSSVTATADVLLSGTLVILLAMSRTGSAGFLQSSVFAIFSLIAVIVLPTTAIYVMFYYIGTRLYSVSLLATLNARASLRIQAERIGHASLPRLSSISLSRKSAVWDGTQLGALPRDVVIAIQHDAELALEDEHAKKEASHGPRREGAEEASPAGDDSASSLRPWEPVKKASFSEMDVP